MAMMDVLSKLEPKQGIWLQQDIVPKVGPRDVLIKIKKTAICGTDLHIYKWDNWAQNTIPIPLTVGHEYVGEIVELGRDVHEFHIGDRVSGEGHITCGFCRNCRAGRRHLCRNTMGVGVERPGAFAEYLAIPAFNAFKVPSSIPDDLVSIFDPFGNAVHMTLSFDVVGEDVLITGAGPIGIMAAAICRHIGARKIIITDVNKYRLDLASKFDITEAVDVSDCKNQEETVRKLRRIMAKHGMTEGFDVGLESSGHPQAINSMIDLMNTGGRMSCLGLSGSKLEVDWDKMVLRGLFLKGIYGREMFETWYKMVALVESGLDVSPVITHNFHYTQFQQAFNIMMQGNCGKVILDWDKDPNAKLKYMAAEQDIPVADDETKA